MQPFDALTMRAVIQEAKPQLLNRRFDRVDQLSRDEIVITLRNRSDKLQFLLSAHAVYGRICICKIAEAKSDSAKKKEYSQLVTLLNRELIGATLVGIEQACGERVVDLIFSCQNQVGSTSFNTLTAEIMGRHSNIIFWRRADKTIIATSHTVTSEMSRYREVSPGLKYVRPPIQTKPNIYKLTKSQFDEDWQSLVRGNPQSRLAQATVLQNWLLNSYSGVGKNLVSEMVDTAILAEPTTTEPIILSDRIWHTVEKLSTQTHFSPAIDSGFQRYRIINLSQPGTDNRQWLSFPTANEMVDCYYQTFQASEISRNLKERLLIQIDSTLAKLKERVSSYKKIIDSGAQIEHDKLCADLILANLNLANSRLAEGQTEFICEYNLNNFSQAELITIPLDVNLSASENAQKYYQRYAREKRRRVAAQINYDQLMLKVSQMEEKQQLIGHSKTLNQLQSIKDEILPPDAKDLSRKKIPAGKSKRRSSIISATSGDGWTIYMGRNRLENDRLLTVIAKPNDIWLHVLGQSGSHVLIKVPSTKLDPPMTTLIEAAQLAAHFSKARSAVKSKVRVVYTHCRFVKKIAGGKPGVVNYEKEKTIEVDVDSSLPSLITQLNR